MKQEYPPLKFLKEGSSSANRQFYTEIADAFKSVGVDMSKIDAEDYIRFCMSSRFMDVFDETIESPYREINQYIVKFLPKFVEASNISLNDIRKGKSDLSSEMRDLWLAPVLFEKWSKCKQVFKPDKDFAYQLMHTKGFELTKNMVSHLPCKDFYIDLQGIADPIVGIFCFAREIGNNQVFVSMYLLSETMVFFSFYFGGLYDEQGVIRIDSDIIDDRTYDIIALDTLPSAKLSYSNATPKLSRKEAGLLALQMICYLSMDTPELTESDLTKHTYRPLREDSIVRNKWSEVRIQEVGVRYGNSYRKKLGELKNNNDFDTEISYNKKERRSPIPHFRCAHWQRYWVGEGRTECRINWIEPVFVGMKDSAKDVVIHKVN